MCEREEWERVEGKRQVKGRRESRKSGVGGGVREKVKEGMRERGERMMGK